MARGPDFAAPAFDDQVALGWSIVRDGSGDRPPLMWIPFIRSERTSLHSAAAAITYGCVAAMNMTIRDIQQDGPRNAAIFTSTFQMGKKVSPYLAYRRPIPWAALHISERSRNARLADGRQMWREVFSPAPGAYQALKEAHLPWVTVSDLALTRPLDSRMRLLILPWPDELTDQQRAVVRRFEQRGGCVVRLDPRVGWHSKQYKPTLMNEWGSAIRDRAGKPPISITGPSAMHAVSYQHPDSKSITICLTNTWGWFQSMRIPSGATARALVRKRHECSNSRIHKAAAC